MWAFLFSSLVHILLAEVVGLEVPLPKCFFTPCLVRDCREAGLSYVLFLRVVLGLSMCSLHQEADFLMVILASRSPRWKLPKIVLLKAKLGASRAFILA